MVQSSMIVAGKRLVGRPSFEGLRAGRWERREKRSWLEEDVHRPSRGVVAFHEKGVGTKVEASLCGEIPEEKRNFRYKKYPCRRCREWKKKSGCVGRMVIVVQRGEEMIWVFWQKAAGEGFLFSPNAGVLSGRNTICRRSAAGRSTPPSVAVRGVLDFGWRSAIIGYICQGKTAGKGVEPTVKAEVHLIVFMSKEERKALK